MEVMTLPMNTEWREDTRGSPWALLDMMKEHALLRRGGGRCFFPAGMRSSQGKGVWPEIPDNAM